MRLRILAFVTFLCLSAVMMAQLARMISLGQRDVLMRPEALADARFHGLLAFLALDLIATTVLLQHIARPARHPVLGALGVALVLVAIWEGEARLAFKIAPSLYLRDADLGIDLSPGYEHTSLRLGRIRINSFGARSDEPSLTDTRRPLKILCLGDSTLFGLKVDQSQLTSTLLQRDLQSRFPDRNVQVMNIARPGSNTSVGAWLLKYRWSPWKPDITLVAYNNDSFSTYSAPLASPQMRVTWPFSTRKLALYRLLGQIIAHEQTRLDPKLEEFPMLTLTLFKENLRELTQQVESWGGRLVFISLPHFQDDRRALSAAFRAAAREQMMSSGQTFADVERSVPRDPNHYIDAYTDPVHLNGSGNRYLEEALLPTICGLVR